MTEQQPLAGSKDGAFGRYLFEYRHDGADWGIEIRATSPEDAKARLKALAFARYQGEIKATVTVPGGGILRRVIAFLRAAGAPPMF